MPIRTELRTELQATLWELAALLWPLSCAGCGVPDVTLCTACRRWLSGSVLYRALPGRPALPVWAAGDYAGVRSRLVLAWKERGRCDLTGDFAAALTRPLLVGRAAGASRGGEVLVVPLPASARSFRGRGADLVAELARDAVRRVPGGGLRSARALQLVRRVRDQTELDSAARLRNLAGALVVAAGRRPAVQGRPCIVLDDVVTTGATAREAARALGAAGARVVGVCCLCVTEPRLGVSGSALLH